MSTLRPRRRKRRKTSLAILIATVALAVCAQTLAPASAGAMIATGGETKCNAPPGQTQGETPSGQPCMILVGGGIIVFEEEEVEVTGTAPPSPTPEPEAEPQPELSFCELYPVACRRAERDRASIRQQHGPDGSGGGRETRGKPSKPQPKEKTAAEKKEECRKLGDEGMVWLSDEQKEKALDAMVRRQARLANQKSRLIFLPSDERDGDVKARIRRVVEIEREIASIERDVKLVHESAARYEKQKCTDLLGR